MVHYDIMDTGIVALFALLVLVVTGCGSYYLFHRDDITDDSPADMARVAALMVWTVVFGGGLAYLLGHLVIWAGQALGLLHAAS